MNETPAQKGTSPELVSKEIRALIDAFSQIGKCACAILDPVAHRLLRVASPAADERVRVERVAVLHSADLCAGRRRHHGRRTDRAPSPAGRHDR